jgi:hypothetical protein
MNLWIIGSTSQYSKAVAKQFTQAGHTVELMGRANLQYGATPGSQLESRETPDFVFININAEDTAYRSTHKRALPSHIDWIGYSEVLDFKHLLYEYLYEINREVSVCEVTSSITNWPHKFPDIMPYSIMRSASQTVCATHSNKLNIFSVCPNGITDELTLQYAELTYNLMRNKPEWGIYNLASGGSLI